MFGRERGVSGAKKKYTDSRRDTVIKITCFFCGEEVELSVQYGYQIKKAYCSKKECLEDRRKSFRKQAIYRRYSAYLDEIKLKNCSQGVTILFQVRNGRLFQGDRDLGKVVKIDDEFVCVQKTVLDSVCLYRRECVQEEDAGK